MPSIDACMFSLGEYTVLMSYLCRRISQLIECLSIAASTPNDRSSASTHQTRLRSSQTKEITITNEKTNFLTLFFFFSLFLKRKCRQTNQRTVNQPRRSQRRIAAVAVAANKRRRYDLLCLAD
jgi:hypothetical protein